MGTFKKPPAYAKQLVARRKLGERIGLLVVAVHDWSAGTDLAARSGTARVVVGEDTLPHELDWSCAVALDCVIVGDCDEAVFYATATMLYAAGAASIWGAFQDGICRLEYGRSALFPMGFYAPSEAVPESQLGRALVGYRTWALMTRAGVYGTGIFDATRHAEYVKVFGEKADQVLAWIEQHQRTPQARAA